MPSGRSQLRTHALGYAALAALFVLTAAVLPLVVDADRFRPTLQTVLSGELGRPVVLGPLKLSLWTGVALRTDRIEIGDLAQGRLTAGPVRLRPALIPFLRGAVDLRGIVAEGVDIARASGPLLRDGHLRARFARGSGGDFTVAGTLRGTWAGLPGAPTGSLTVDCAQRGAKLDLKTLNIEAGPTRLDLKAAAEGVGTGHSRWQLEGTGRGPASQGRGQAALELDPETPRLDLTLDFARLERGAYRARL